MFRASRVTSETCTYFGNNLLPSQFRPFPAKPSLQSQMNEPTVLMQLAFWWQRSYEHSSTSKSLELYYEIKSNKSYWGPLNCS